MYVGKLQNFELPVCGFCECPKTELVVECRFELQAVAARILIVFHLLEVVFRLCQKRVGVDGSRYGATAEKDCYRKKYRARDYQGFYGLFLSLLRGEFFLFFLGFCGFFAIVFTKNTLTLFVGRLLVYAYAFRLLDFILHRFFFGVFDFVAHFCLLVIAI